MAAEALSTGALTSGLPTWSLMPETVSLIWSKSWRAFCGSDIAADACDCMPWSFSRPDFTAAQASAFDWSADTFASADGFDEEVDEADSPEPPAEQPVTATATVETATTASARRAARVFFMIPLC